MYFEKISKEQWYKDFEWCDNVDIVDKIYDNIKLPTRATRRSAGYDFFAPCEIIISPKATVKIPTGIRWICNTIDGNNVLFIAPRSGLGFKYGVRLVNTLGVVDADFASRKDPSSGHIFIKLYNPSNETINIDAGKAFAQGIITHFLVCDDDDVTTERNGGFGSTDK